MKLVIYIINPEDYANGEYPHSMSCTTTEHWDWWQSGGHNSDYLFLAEVDVDSDYVSRDWAAAVAADVLDKRMEDIRAKTDAELTQLDNRKGKLLSLPGAAK